MRMVAQMEDWRKKTARLAFFADRGTIYAAFVAFDALRLMT